MGNFVGRGALIAAILIGSAGAASADAILFSSSQAAQHPEEILLTGATPFASESGGGEPFIWLTIDPTGDGGPSSALDFDVSALLGRPVTGTVTLMITDVLDRSTASVYNINSRQNHFGVGGIAGLETQIGLGGAQAPETQDVSIPEPSLLLLMGIGAFGVWRRLSPPKLIASRR